MNNIMRISTNWCGVICVSLFLVGCSFGGNKKVVEISEPSTKRVISEVEQVTPQNIPVIKEAIVDVPQVAESVAPVVEKNEEPVSKEPDLTSLFDSLYKIPIDKSDLNEVSGSKVVEIQKSLNAIGYNVGSADGKAGKNTLNGINRFLEDFELPLDPRPTGLLIKQLNAVNDASSGQSIIGSIKLVQSALQKAGFAVGQAGIADATTRQAILDYQVREGLIVDGRLTNQLLTSLKVK